MTQVTSEEVWTAIINDPRFQQQDGFMSFQSLVEAMPVVLAEQLDVPATAASIMTAKAVFLRYCLEHGFSKLIAREDALLAAAMFETIASDVESFLEKYHTKESVAVMQLFNLRDEAWKLYQANTLTIGDLLKYQPRVIFNPMLSQRFIS